MIHKLFPLLLIPASLTLGLAINRLVLRGTAAGEPATALDTAVAQETAGAPAINDDLPPVIPASARERPVLTSRS